MNGEKLWISNAIEAGVFLVFANANPSLKHKGITAFMVDANTEGVVVGKPEKKLGLRASRTCPVVFDNVKVDATDVLGDVGLGYKYCINILNEGRIGIASQQIGVSLLILCTTFIIYPLPFDLYDMLFLKNNRRLPRAALILQCLISTIGLNLELSLPIFRYVFLSYISQISANIASLLIESMHTQGMEHQYAQIATEIHAAEVMTYNACRMKENGMDFVKEASMVKLFASQVAEKAASKSIEWLGGIGFTQNLLAEKFFRDCKVGSIYEGTSNIQLQTIAKRIKEEYR